MPATDQHGKIVRAKDHAYKIEAMLNAQKDRLAQLLPSVLTPERLIRTAVITMRRDPKLMACTTGSVLGGIIQAAALGLEIGTGLGHAYLVPFKNKGVSEATLIIGYKGLCDLAYRSSDVISVRARAVYDGDVFDYEEGVPRFIRHKRLASDRTPDKLTHAYAVATIRDVPETQSPWGVLDREDIDKAMARSRAAASKFSPWHTDYEMMARKTAVRRLIDKGEIPASAEMRKAAELDEAADNNLPQAYPDVPHEVLDVDDWIEGEQGGG